MKLELHYFLCTRLFFSPVLSADISDCTYTAISTIAIPPKPARNYIFIFGGKGIGVQKYWLAQGPYV